MAVSSWLSRMLGMELTLDNLGNVLVLQLRDLLSAEEQLIEALPKMIEAAHSPDLKAAFSRHLEETRIQKSRLQECLMILNRDASSETCEAMQGLLEEGDQILWATGDPDVKDAAIIASAQRVEHYEIAAYGCARTFARRLGYERIANLLQESLDEEGLADKALTDVAESFVNVQAARS